MLDKLDRILVITISACPSGEHDMAHPQCAMISPHVNGAPHSIKSMLEPSTCAHPQLLTVN